MIANKTPRFDVAGFKAFVAAQPPEKAYDASSVTRCALAQFGAPPVTQWDCESFGIPLAVYKAAVPAEMNYTIAPRTFGALLERLEAVT